MMAERPEDLNLPTPVVSKLISDCLPANCKVTDEAKVAITKVVQRSAGLSWGPHWLTCSSQAASVFVLYATSQANSMAHNQSRKTIYGQDVIMAMNEMEFDKFVRPLENSLASINNINFLCIQWFVSVWKKGQQEKKEQAAKKKASKKDSEAGDSKSIEPEVIEIDWSGTNTWLILCFMNKILNR